MIPFSEVVEEQSLRVGGFLIVYRAVMLLDPSHGVRRWE